MLDVPAPTQPAIARVMSDVKRILRAVMAVASVGVREGNASTALTLQVTVLVFLKSVVPGGSGQAMELPNPAAARGGVGGRTVFVV